ncbi:DNA-(apurinic or apyrimidinic site) lyase [Xanthoria calcicola]
MPSLSRKRGAPPDNNATTPVKRSRRAKRESHESSPDGSDIEPRTEQVLVQGTNKKVTRSKRAQAAPLPGGTNERGRTGSATQEVKQEVENNDIAITKTPRKGGNRVKTQTASAKEERREEEGVAAVQTTPKKARKRKAANGEEEEQAHDDPAPKKVKGKRKTKEEKEAEAMPLAARSTGLRMFIGAHVSGAKGVQNSVTNCVHIGGNAFALFLKSQRKWENPPLQDEHRDGFKSNCIEHQYDATKHILPHGSYLVNLAQEDPDKAKQAYDSFLEDLQRCEALGVKLYNFHPGTTNNAPRSAAIARIASALNRAHASTTTVTPLLETMAGSGNVIGSTFNDLASIISLIENKSRVGVCLDTCHLFAAGYDLRTPTSFSAVIQDLDETVGLQYVKALHLNDSKAPFGSRRDLHANIGTGFLGLRAFWNVMNEKRFEGLPMVLETPIDRKVDGGEGEMKVKKDVGNDGEEEPATGQKGRGKATSKDKGPAKPPKEKTVEDKSIWAREIKLLESLIGMDVEGEEFKWMEKELADQGAEEREKHLEAFERKLEKEQKVKTKDIGSFFVKGKAKTKAKGDGNVQQAVEDAGSPLSELSDLSDDSDK